MSDTSRPALPDSSPSVVTSEVSGGKFADRPPNSDPCESRGARQSPAAGSRGGLHIRSHRSPRRSSSGYFSSESQPGSPMSPRPLTADQDTQTPSLSAQVIVHARHAVNSPAAERGHRESAPQQQQQHHQQQQQQHERSASSARPSDSMRDMQAVLIGQELRRHGDEFNRILTQRRQAAGVHPQWWPVVHPQPTVVICVGLMIFFFGRLLYSHGATYNQPQV